MTTDLPKEIAIALYKSDGVLLAMYSDPRESWKNDRQDVRDKYLRYAAAAINVHKEVDIERIRSMPMSEFSNLLNWFHYIHHSGAAKR